MNTYVVKTVFGDTYELRIDDFTIKQLMEAKVIVDYNKKEEAPNEVKEV